MNLYIFRWHPCIRGGYTLLRSLRRLISYTGTTYHKFRDQQLIAIAQFEDYVMIYGEIYDVPGQHAQTVHLYQALSLVPMPLPVFQCCTLKNGPQLLLGTLTYLPQSVPETGIPVATDKVEGPTASLTFLGLELDTVTQDCQATNLQISWRSFRVGSPAKLATTKRRLLSLLNDVNPPVNMIYVHYYMLTYFLCE